MQIGSRIAGFLLLSAAAVIAQSNPAQARCNPNGVESEIIACIEEGNAAKKANLARSYPKYLAAIESKCAKENPGGGSGGRADRATCIAKEFDKEVLRVGQK